MPIDEAIEKPQCSRATLNAVFVFPLDISPIPNIKKQTDSWGHKAASSGLLVGWLWD